MALSTEVIDDLFLAEGKRLLGYQRLDPSQRNIKGMEKHIWFVHICAVKELTIRSANHPTS